MSETVLTSEQILEAAEDVLRRFGPTKANVVDVARALGVSHGSVYRHFASKATLRDAVAERWLARISAPLAKVAATPGPAPERLRRSGRGSARRGQHLPARGRGYMRSGSVHVLRLSAQPLAPRRPRPARASSRSRC